MLSSLTDEGRDSFLQQHALLRTEAASMGEPLPQITGEGVLPDSMQEEEAAGKVAGASEAAQNVSVGDPPSIGMGHLQVCCIPAAVSTFMPLVDEKAICLAFLCICRGGQERRRSWRHQRPLALGRRLTKLAPGGSSPLKATQPSWKVQCK
jgi:hypothetical protein